MEDEQRRHDEGEDGARALRAWTAIAARQAGEVVRQVGDDPGRTVALAHAIEHVAAIEQLLPEDDPLRNGFVPLLGVLMCVRIVSRGTGDQSDAARRERKYALRHLRWADRTRPLTDPIAAKARGALLRLLVPAHYARAVRAERQGPRQEPRLRAFGSQPLTVSLRDELAEARGVIERLAGGPEDPERRRVLGFLTSEIERTLSSASGFSALSGGRSPAAAERPEPTDTALLAEIGEAEGSGEAGERADDLLADAVHTVLGWASDDLARFTELLVWLYRTADRATASPEEADAEVAALGLDRPAFAPLHALLTGLRSGEGDPRALAPRVRHGADVARRALRELPDHTPERARIAKLHAVLLVHANLLVPGTMDFDEVDEAMSEPGPDPDDRPGGPGYFGLEQQLAALVDGVRVSQTGDLAHLETSAARLREMMATSPGDGERATAARRTLATGLAGLVYEAATLGGSLRAADAARTMGRELRAASEGDDSLTLTNKLTLVVFAAQNDLALARRSGDPTVLPRLIEELTGLYATLSPDQENRFTLASTLAEVHQEQAARSQDPEEFRAAAWYLREVVGTDSRRIAPMLRPYFPALRAFALIRLIMIEPSRDAADEAIAEVHRILEGPQPTPREELRLRYQLGRALLHVARHLDDPDLLDVCITELSQVREMFARGNGLPHSADALTQLSEAHWLRRERGGPSAKEDREAALATRSEALVRLSADVLLQLGSEHGLSVARFGSAQALWLAYWTTVCDRPADAVHALERGRALVLRAAAASRGIPELLEARGHPDLARQWRAEVAADAPQPDTADPLQPGTPAAPSGQSTGPQIPGTLRRRALEALGAGSGADAWKLLGPPDLPSLTAGLTAAGADALVYLVPGQRPGMPGFALILRPGTGDARPTVLKLPLLTPGSPPLERYLDATARRSRAAADAPADAGPQMERDERWEASLRDLCDWAWPAAMGPVLAAVGPLHRPPRIVLVPCGPLGAVAWHAARTPYGTAGREHRYACEDAVLSYAPSGAEFLRAATRDRLPTTAGQVLVADPELSLVWAEIEAEALRAACYPDGLRYGEFPTATVGDAPGTPEDILAVLPGGGSPVAVLHISCHALAGPDPTRSALWLAAPPAGPEDGGRLTVARILDGAATGQPDAAGPLVVLSACETDLSTRDHDEALTLSTALIARGAADVIGSRWAVHDATTALMMAVFHDFVTRQRLAPVDALRAAQLWMLDPRREPPPTLHAELCDEAVRTDLDRIHLWAAFTHQGNPAARRAG
ncbi:CHAT domain-containing protein [Streptomyces sp. NEAU-YJ-81]|uniref:CHAT domain-containing protein n=1 Tax=Streptomyces sp. NEAU-YJ-81 TaxID=2820288 RepID=UPI001ABD22E8|nr:CHAT domain-containing protein [Streptomyces sp. NEAU-YJ-81]MBO3676497.1 CHAT domain-containing protein [Streptomyces sp. NEAU-YJ-81]